MEELVFLDLIDPNPWQPREREDPAHIESLAASIKTDGLMQVPVGRKMGERVQLAFGHSRLAAFKLLRLQRMDNGYMRMPVVIRELTDEEMFRQGIGENLARKNLTPIEEALAMTRFRDDFHKTSEEIGKLFNMGDSGVRNKMRLLKLPEDLQNCLRRGEMAEGVARELLAVCELPEDARLAAEEQDEFLKPSEIIEAAKSGSNQKSIAEMVSRFMQHIGKRAAQPAPKPEPAPVTREETPPWMAQRSTGGEVAPAVDREPDPVETHRASVTISVATPSVVPAATFSPAATPAPITPEPEPTPAVIPAPDIKPATWAESTITLTLTYWPADGNPGGRTVMAGARANTNLPMMRMFREDSLTLSEQLADIMDALKAQQFGGE
jgi:ParB/RepB/Spo0J family partition protein